jgi:hypothetical protein
MLPTSRQEHQRSRNSNTRSDSQPSIHVCAFLS